MQPYFDQSENYSSKIIQYINTIVKPTCLKDTGSWYGPAWLPANEEEELQWLKEYFKAEQSYFNFLDNDEDIY